MSDLVANLQQAKAAYQQARRALAAHAQHHWIGRQATGTKRSYALTSTIASVTPAGRVRLDFGERGVSFDIEEIRILELPPEELEP